MTKNNLNTTFNIINIIIHLIIIILCYTIITKINILINITDNSKNQDIDIEPKPYISEVLKLDIKEENEETKKETIVTNTNIIEEAQEPIFMPLPENIATNMFMYMDYRKITNPTSDQYSFQQDLNVYTNDLGIRAFAYNNEEYLMVAMGEIYGIKKGHAYNVTLENNYSFKVVIGDLKHSVDYGHTCINYDNEDTINVIEFIVDIEKIDERTKLLGTFSYQEDKPFNDNIKIIEDLGIIWNNKRIEENK